jgi:hypothetical protein
MREQLLNVDHLNKHDHVMRLISGALQELNSDPKLNSAKRAIDHFTATTKSEAARKRQAKREAARAVPQSERRRSDRVAGLAAAYDGAIIDDADDDSQLLSLRR